MEEQRQIPESPSKSISTTTEVVDTEELIALIKAIKFKYPDYGVKRVHSQIKTHGDKYANVPLKRVKKFIQKLGLVNSQESAAEDKQDPIQLMTVGGDSKSARPKETSSPATESSSMWFPVKLDEPGSKMKSFPYQAVIRMNTSEEGLSHDAMGEMYKIQVALGPDNSLSNVHPMLVYNKARDRKTFLHPDSPAYVPVQTLIKARGFSGAVGGSKAYFYGRYAKKNDMVYINTEKLAPFQKW